MDTNRTWKKSFRCLALVLVFAMLCSMGVLAENTVTSASGTTYPLATSAWITGNSSTGRLTIEAYLDGENGKTREVSPCDIIFVLDQFRWVNGTQGADREAVLSAMKELLDCLPAPTDETEEHRIAIAGCGRVNVNQSLDSYNASEYPGTQHRGNSI
jgi:hypothetical protein